jgi:hypothetical protein
LFFFNAVFPFSLIFSFFPSPFFFNSTSLYFLSRGIYTSCIISGSSLPFFYSLPSLCKPLWRHDHFSISLSLLLTRTKQISWFWCLHMNL